jgi:hypothetical protein
MKYTQQYLWLIVCTVLLTACQKEICEEDNQIRYSLQDIQKIWKVTTAEVNTDKKDFTISNSQIDLDKLVLRTDGQYLTFDKQGNLASNTYTYIDNKLTLLYAVNGGQVPIEYTVTGTSKSDMKLTSPKVLLSKPSTTASEDLILTVSSFFIFNAQISDSELASVTTTGFSLKFIQSAE